MAGTGSSKNVDPIAYRAEEQQQVDTPVTEQSTNWQFDPSKLQNADVNLSAYGDDSSEANYNNKDLWGGENTKYTGENTKNTSVAYDANATLENLNPNYAYGQKAQMVNSSDAGYIQRRNDQIASALYNAGKTSIQDVADFLNQQEGFQNSEENERNNTIASVWKRLGEISSNQPQNENNEDTNAGVENNEAVNKMEQDLLQGTDGKIYGKNTADVNGEDSAIKTAQDQYNVERAVNEQRIANMKNLQTMDSKDIATSIVAGTTPYGDQGMRDLMQYDPQKYQEVQNYIKQIKGQKNINSISQNGTLDSESSITSTDIEGDIDSWAKQNSTDGNYKEIASSVKEELESNETASTAQKEMNNLSADIAKLQTRLKNIDKEARDAFKSDVPQYLVNAYKANKQLEIQDKISELEARYNTALNLYKTELSNTQWEKEFGLKQQQLQMQQQSQNFDQWYKKQTLQNSMIIKDSSGNSWQLKTADDGTLYYEKVSTVSTGTGMRTERNNNPTAMTSDVARSLGLVEGVDYLVGDAFPNNANLHTAYLLGDPIETTIKGLDTAASTGRGAFYTQGGKQRWTHTAMSDEAWLGLSDEEKRNVVLKMLHNEGGDINNMAYYTNGGTSAAGSQDVSGVFNRRDGEMFNTLNAPTYNSLSYDKQNTVKGLLNLSINPTTITKRQYGDDFESILSAVQEINPNWSTADYGQADKAKKERNTSSKNGSNSRNATAMATAKEVWEMADVIGNTTFKDWNSMLNKIRSKVSDTDFIRLQVNLQTMASEFAGALKGGTAAPTEKEIADAKELISSSFSNGGMKAAAEQIAKQLYNKNVTEADNYRNVTLEKPNSPWIGDVPEWMYNYAGIDISEYYDYKNPNAIDLSGLQALANMLNF